MCCKIGRGLPKNGCLRSHVRVRYSTSSSCTRNSENSRNMVHPSMIAWDGSALIPSWCIPRKGGFPNPKKG